AHCRRGPARLAYRARRPRMASGRVELMRRYLLSSLVQAIVVLMCVLVLVFTMVRATGDPARLMLAREATNEQVEAFRANMGFARPVIVQFIEFVGDAATGDFGNSLHCRLPALPLILERLPA